MLAWVVINRQQPHQFTTKSSSPCTLCLCVKLSGSFPPTPVVSTAYGHPSTTAAPQLLCNQSVTHAFCLDGGCTPLGASTAYPLLPMPYLLPYHTLAHSFALFCTQQNLNSIVFNRFRTLCPKHPGVGYPSSWFNVAKRHRIQGRMTLWP